MKHPDERYYPDLVDTVKELQDELLTIKGSISKLRLRIRKIEGVLL